MSKELMDALDLLEKEKNISKDSLFDAIENSLVTACKNNFGKAENIRVEVDRENCDFKCYAEKTVVETADDVMDPMLEISLDDAKKISKKSNEYYKKEHDIVTGVIQRYVGKNISINLGRADAILNENEQVESEAKSGFYKPTSRIRLYVLEVKNGSKGPRILVSRTHPDLVKRLFEQEVAEIQDGTVEIKSIAREAGSRTKIAVFSNNPNVDAVGACVGVNGARVNLIVDELNGEKIDVINWDENPGNLIQNALSPAKIVAVFADPDEKSAKVVVPDYQLSLAIGKEGQNARLAARLTGYKIDIKSETQAKDAPGFRMEDYLDDEDDYDEEEFEETEIEEAEDAEIEVEEAEEVEEEIEVEDDTDAEE